MAPANNPGTPRRPHHHPRHPATPCRPPRDHHPAQRNHPRSTQRNHHGAPGARIGNHHHITHPHPAAHTPTGATNQPASTQFLGDPHDDAYTLTTTPDTITVTGRTPNALLYGYFALLRHDLTTLPPTSKHTPATAIRMLDHWDNLSVHPVMGQIERGYAGDSIFYTNGAVRENLTRVADYARLLASLGINHVAINNVNVERDAARLLTDNINDVARIAAIFRNWGIRTHLSVSFGSPMSLGGLTSNDPLDPQVRQWWADTFTAVYSVIPDFGGIVIKADSEGQPGPFAYGRTHADGANMLAEALAPHHGIVHWRAFVYNHTQDWRDRTTDRARAAYEHFAPHDGTFADNAIVQIKFGPMDFQAREPISPTFAAMPHTNLSLEFQVTQEYTGQQRHICYLGTQWSEIMRFTFWPTSNPHTTLADIPVSFTAVSNVGMSAYWTGHPLAQANLYAYGRLTWDPTADPGDILTEWLTLTFPHTPAATRTTLHHIMASSWDTYEKYTAPWGSVLWSPPVQHTTAPTSTGTNIPPGAPTTSRTVTVWVWTAPEPAPALWTSTRPNSLTSTTTSTPARTNWCCSSTMFLTPTFSTPGKR